MCTFLHSTLDSFGYSDNKINLNSNRNEFIQFKIQFGFSI